MGVTDAIASVLDELRRISPGVFCHAGNVYSIVRSFSTGDARSMVDSGYDPEEIDMVVLLARDQLHEKQIPRPGDECDLDGVLYCIKSPMTSNAAFLQMPLRKLR